MRAELQSAEAIQASLTAGDFTSVELTQLFLQRIDALNGTMNAFITVTPETALAQARRSDEERARGRTRGPLHGIPVAIKDIIETRGIRTTSGARFHADSVPTEDATVVGRLAEAGAVALGKTNMTELAYGISGRNPFYGTVANPWAPGHETGGSSSGSAAAVAAGLCTLAVGTDTGCSVRQPAHCCGVVGFKPTFGVVSKAGVRPLVRSMDHVGFLTRSVGDAADMLDALGGYDPCDPYSCRAPLCRDAAAGRDLADLRVGIMRRMFFDGRSDVVGVVDGVIDALRAAGADVRELEAPDPEAAFAATRAMFADTAAVHADDVRACPEGFSEAMRNRILGSGETRLVDYLDALQHRREFTARMERLMADVDVLAAPTSTIAAPPVDDMPDDYGLLAWRNTCLFNFTGQPSISVPCGFSNDGLPVGLMLTGRLLEDHKVLHVARVLEARLGLQVETPPIDLGQAA